MCRSRFFDNEQIGIAIACLFWVKQLSLLREKKYSKRKTARPISLRGANHVILKTEQFVLRKNVKTIRALIRETQDRFGIKLRAVSIMGNHLHLVLRVRSRKQFGDSLRFLAGMIALRIANAKLWKARAWSRPLKYGKDMRIAESYVWNNSIKARCFEMIDTCLLIDEVLQL